MISPPVTPASPRGPPITKPLDGLDANLFPHPTSTWQEKHA